MRSVVIVCTLIISVLFLQTTEPLEAFAASSLPSGVVIGDDSGLYATSEGEYFIDIPEAVAGESYEKEITIRCLDVEEPFELGLLVNKVTSKGSIDFNEYMTMTLTLDGEQLYKGPILGDGTTDWSLEPLVLGVCEYGTDHMLDVHIEMAKGLSVTQFKEASELLFQWTFVATKNQPEPTKPTEEPTVPSEEPIPTTPSKELPSTAPAPKSPVAALIDRLLPKTGEDVENALLKMVAGIWLVIIAIVLWKRRKDREEES
ncbi:LPXTG cell wall anchor domain-containing protein [Enterococcus sp. 669A]|uniref:LPXTG cell wall anchor domain-containing protein n=1 Tax=Candidatus Enterococcus moelleringii TaxID=2815325 RepID=A0ABS3LDY0_9ENTE|nr:LPXTG cell wall anchor domain-containing protein [Enterococcus sp. 669A]